MPSTARKDTPLTLVERAQQALFIEHTEAELKKMARESRDITTIKDDADYELAKRSRISLKSVRVSIEKAGKSARLDATAFSKAVIAEEKRLVGIIGPEEKRLQGLQTVVDERAAREAEEKRHAEESRIQGLIAKIQSINDYATIPFTANSGEILLRLQAVNAIICDEGMFEEYMGQAEEARTQTLIALDEAYKARKAFEKQQAEQARIAEEQAERQAELDRQEAERREEERKRKEEIARQEVELKARQDRFNAEIRRQEEEKLAAERAEAEKVRKEKERLEGIEAERKAEEERQAREKAEAKRQEALRPEKERLIDWLKKLRFIDGVELHNKNLIAIQQRTLKDLSTLSETMVKVVEDA